MGYVRMELMGAGEAQRMLDAVHDVPEMALQALQAGADVLLPIEKAHAPIGPGHGAHIRDKLAIKVKRNGGNPVVLVGVWDNWNDQTNPPIPYYVEKGHGGPHPAPAHPYMEPAADEAEDAVVAAITDVVRSWLDGDGG